MRRSLFAFLLFTFYFSPAQTDSCGLRISLLTCTPGQELYSTFGHSALRVFDSANQTDLVFNYGTFDFYDPKFYNKFVKGKLLYFVSIDTLPSFLAEYDYYKRGITEQAINIPCNEKQKLLAALFENAKEENKYYRYDFNYDNCTTRLRDMVEKAAGSKLETKNILPAPATTFRHLIHFYLDRGGQQWSKLGIDMLLGNPMDKKVTNREAMFLPDYLLMAFDSSELNGQPVVQEKKILLNYFESYKTKSGITPVIVFGVLFLLITLLSILTRHPWHLFFKIFDFFFFIIVGLIGVLILFMWFGTEHAMCKNNFNLLWALPTHLPIAFMLFNKKPWINSYFRFILFYTIILLLAWFFLPQQFNRALLPVMGIILIRSFFLSKR
ncbi:MAG TPA: DUF4105 domain-containing protein [Chitinophagaceae bacterium]|nr:DUF4105 domain-containing protein [Chitinophagaceae bacterium]